MGHQIGGQCFGTEQEASNYLMSQVIPTIMSDGSLKTPIYQSGQWYYGDQQVNLTFPECSQEAIFKDGIQVGAQLSVLLFIAFGIRLGIKLFSRNAVEDDKGVY